MDRTKGVSLAKGPVGIIGAVLLAGGILGLLFGSTSFSADPPDGTATGDTWFGIEGNGWNWALFGGSGLLVLADASGSDAFGIFAANDATTLVFAVAAAALLFFALMPRVGRRPAAEPGEAASTRPRRFRRRRERAAEPTERRET